MFKYSIIIVCSGNDWLIDCLDSVQKNTVGDKEILFVQEKLSGNFAKAVNHGLEQATGKYIIVLHDDTLVPMGWNVRLSDAFEVKDKVSCVGPFTCLSDSIQARKEFAGFEFLTDVENIQSMISTDYKANLICAKISSFCFLTSKKLWQSLGPLEDLPEELALTEWIIRAMKFRYLPYIDTSSYVHHTDKHKSSKEEIQAGKGKIISLHAIPALEFVEHDLYLNLK